MNDETQLEKRNGTRPSKPLPLAPLPSGQQGAPDPLLPPRAAVAPGGFVGRIRSRRAAHAHEQQAEVEVRTLRAEEQVLRQRLALAEAHLEARTAVVKAEAAYAQAQAALAEAAEESRMRRAEKALRADEAEGKLHDHRLQRLSEDAEAQQRLRAEIETERLRGELEQLRRRRENGAWASPAPPALPPAAVEAHISDADIQAMALRAFRRYGALDDLSAQAAWALWREGLAETLPPYAVLEVEREVDRLRGLAP